MERAAIYVRVSTDGDAQRDSPLHQVETCKEYARTVGFSTSEDSVYNDAGFSGTEFEQRSEVKRLLSDARMGRFEVVLFTAISRFSRDLTDAFNLKKKLEFVYGIRLISLEEGYDTAVEGRNNDMVFTVHAMLAAHKSKEMSLAIRRGLRQAAKRGRHIGNRSPYGYQKTIDQKLCPNPDTAPQVRRMFEWYQSGMSTRQIAHMLTQNGVPTAMQVPGRAAVAWQSSTVSAILRNPVYVGKIIANKWTRRPDVVRSRQYDFAVQKLFVRSSDEWIVVEGAHEPLIPEDLFMNVQHRLAAGCQQPRPRNKNHVLARLVVCGTCGRSMVLTGNRRRNRFGVEKQYQYLVCATVKKVGRQACANHVATNYTDLVQVVRFGLEMASKSSFEDGSVSKPQPGADVIMHLNHKLRQIEQEMNENKDRQRENLHAYHSGLFSQDVIVQAQQELLDHMQRLHQDRKEIIGELEMESHAVQFRSPESFGQGTDDTEGCTEGRKEGTGTPMQTSAQWLSNEGLTLIDEIVIDETGAVHVYFAFRCMHDCTHL